MGFSTDLQETISFIYKAPFENGLTEHEYDYILVGEYNDDPQPNPDEVNAWKWMKLEDIEVDIKKNPSNYTEWFKIIFAKHKSEMIKSST
jgi:isopentenyl-diphosphate delta-isomerase